MRHATILAAFSLAACATVPPVHSRFDYSDVTRFYQVYDAARGHPDAATLQSHYLNPGSPGLKSFIPNRIISSERLAKRIEEKPDVYRIARSYYDRSQDKHAALKRLLTDPDVKAILHDSGWSETS